VPYQSAYVLSRFALSALLNWPAVITYRLMPRVFDAVIGPFVRAAAFESERSTSDS
jgi:hypothetical protein